MHAIIPSSKAIQRAPLWDDIASFNGKPAQSFYTFQGENRGSGGHIALTGFVGSEL